VPDDNTDIYDMKVSRERRNQGMDSYMSQIATHSTFDRDIFELTVSRVGKEGVEPQAIRIQRENCNQYIHKFYPRQFLVLLVICSHARELSQDP
jgi:hypothetical protein